MMATKAGGPARYAAWTLMGVLGLVVVFHGLVMLGAVPFEIVWGGRLKSHAQMLQFETVSIVLNLLMLLVVAVHTRLLRVNISRKVTQGLLWAMVGLFLVNTAGNIFSSNSFEKLFFTPLTFVLMLCSARLALATNEAR
jgi:hypothetical protein